MTDWFPFVMDTHVTDDWPEWGSAPRGPLIDFDMAHRGEWLGSVIGDDVVTGTPMVYQVCRCELCIATHVWPLPSADALASYYQAKFYQGPAALEVGQHERDHEHYEQCVYGPVLEQCRALKPDALRILDIGAGSGLLLDTARQYGWRTMGIEPDLRQCDALRSRGHTMGQGMLENHGRLVETYAPDVVTLWETLEHQPCPEDFLLQCHSAMRPEALLVISVPNDYSPLQLAACHKFRLPHYWLIPPVHLFYWTPKTLQLCVRRCGFQILDMRGTYPLEVRMVEEGGVCYVGNSVQWRMYTEERNMMELCAAKEHYWDDVEALYRGNLADRRGRSIICIAKRV